MNRWHAATIAMATALFACASRPPAWNAPVDLSLASYGLNRGAVVLDHEQNRALVLTAQTDQSLATSILPIGHGGITAMPSPDGERLFVLSGGDAPSSTGNSQPPMLTVISIDVNTFVPSEVTYPMVPPLGGLALDPLGHWAVAYVAAFANGDRSNTPFVQDPNQLVFFDLTQPSGTLPQPYELTSFGGSPARLTFTPTLNLPEGPGQLVVVEATTSDVHLIDMAHVFQAQPRTDVVIRLTEADDTTPVTSQGLAIAPADLPGNPLMAIRTTSSDVISWSLGPPNPGNVNSFEPVVNETSVLGVPSDIGFVMTDGGLRVAAIVPSTTSAVLFDPVNFTGMTTTVSLPSNLSRMSLITGDAGGSTGTDVALLWGQYASGVAIWALGDVVSRSYDSTEFISVAGQVTAVEDVPAPNQALKILEISGGQEFFVLDLVNQTASLLNTTAAPTLSISPNDGERVWAFASGETDLASIDLTTGQSTPLTTVLPISAAYEVARASPSATDSRSLLAVSFVGTLGVTVFDAASPRASVSHTYSDLLLEGL
ncbi:MAG: hypothetical protein ABTD50_20875 [Polyangiaceae bacterium]